MFAFLNTSMSNGIQRFYNFQLGKEGEKSFTKVYNTALIVQGLLAIIIVILLETVGLWYLHAKMIIPEDRFVAAQWIYHFSVISLILVIIQIPYSAAIMAAEKMDFYAYVGIFEVLAKLTVAIILPHISADKLIWYGLLNLIVGVISFSLYFSYAKNKIKSLKIELAFHKDLFKSMISFSGWNVFGTFAYMLKGQGLNVLINAFFGVVVNSARGISNMIMSAIQGFQANIVISFRPQLVQSYAKGELSRVKNLFYSLSKISYILLLVLSLPVIIEIDYILHLWLGDIIPDYTIPFTILVLANMVVSSLTTPISQVVHATGKLKVFQIVTSCVVCSIVPISWVVLKLGGDPVSVFWVSLIITIINQVVCVFLLKRVFQYSIRDYLTNVIFKCLLLTMLTFILPFVLHLIMPSSFIRLILVCIVEILIACVVAYFVAFNDSERILALNFVKKIIKKGSDEHN